MQKEKAYIYLEHSETIFPQVHQMKKRYYLNVYAVKNIL